MRRTLTLIMGCFFFLGSGFAYADDHDDVLAFVNRYCELEGDLEAQAAMIAPDRVMVTPALRQTNQALNMKMQEMGRDRQMKMDPGLQLVVRCEDPLVRVYGDTAVASMYRYWSWMWSADYLKENDPPVTNTRDVTSLVLRKQGNEWKIVHTHISPFHPSN